ncbi:MAG: hypothetical protein LW821_04625 [Flammeovirgaceae bacterium]|nr:hypothetical protein [Flammeovirgaceae bacterium]
MQQLTFDAPAWALPIMAITAFIAARYLYSEKKKWSKFTLYTLLTIRTLFIFLLLFLLLGPILKLTKHTTQKPVVVLLADKSASVTASADSVKSKSTFVQMQQLAEVLAAKGFEVVESEIDVQVTKTNLSNAINKVWQQNEGKKISHLILASDGIFNDGVSPLYKDYPFQIYTIGLGDSTIKRDLSIKNLTYNKIAYQGNKFQLVADVSTQGFVGESVEVSVYQQGKKLDEKTIVANESGFATAEFLLKADKNGLQKYEVVVKQNTNEYNKKNNSQNAYIEVIEGKKKIVVVAASPHPDVKAIRAALEKNDNYQLSVYVPGIAEGNPEKAIAEADLVIVHQLPNTKVRSNWLSLANTSKAACLFLFGEQSDWQEATRMQYFTLENLPRQKDEVLAVINPAFSFWTYSQALTDATRSWPPLSVPFVKYAIAPTANVLFYQQIGSVPTTKPLLWIDQQKDKKQAFLLGEGFWRWRLQEYNQTEQHTLNDEFWSKLVQYLSTSDDKVRFRCFPVSKEVSLNEEVVIEAQVYNPLYEPIYGQEINLEITNEKRNKSKYQFTTSANNSRFVLGNLPEGIYTYTATVQLENQVRVNGEFVVANEGIELMNTQADFNLLRNLSAKTSGTFFLPEQIENLQKDIENWQTSRVLLAEDTYDPLINLALFFVLLIILISSEWFLRKYNGSY